MVVADFRFFLAQYFKKAGLAGSRITEKGNNHVLSKNLKLASVKYFSVGLDKEKSLTCFPLLYLYIAAFFCLEYINKKNKVKKMAILGKLVNEEVEKIKQTEERKKRDKSVFREYFELIAETAVFVFFVMTYVVQAFQIPTGSMEPTLLVGDFLLVNKFIYARPVIPLESTILPCKKIERKDIVVFKFPRDLKKDYVKRVIALEGEKVEIKDKEVYVNDRPLEEKYKVHIDAQVFQKNGYYQYDDVIRDNFGPVVVPPGHLFVMGDNRDNSLDSRYWGFLPMNYLKGRPWLIYFSYEAERDAYLKNGVQDKFKKFFRFFSKTRWSRIMKVVF